MYAQTPYSKYKRLKKKNKKDTTKSKQTNKQTQQTGIVRKFINHFNINKYNYCHSYLVNVLDARKLVG